MLSMYLSMVETDEERDKLTYIYENFYPFMAYSAGKVLSFDQNDIDDAVHNAMIRIIEILPKIDFSQPSRVKCLCCIIAENQAKDYCKQRDNQNIPMDEEITELFEDDCSPVEELIKKETYDQILKAIKSLDAKYRDVCILKYIYKMKEREIADALSLPCGTVSVRIQRGRQKIKDSLKKEDFDVQ